MANRPGFPGKTNKVYPDPVPQRVPSPPDKTGGGSGYSDAGTPGSPDVQTSEKHGTIRPLSLAYGTTPAGATKGDTGNPRWGAPSAGAPQPGKDGP